MVLAMFAIMFCGCGSFGLQSIELTETSGRLGASPQDEVDFGKVIEDRDVGNETITLKATGDESVRVVSVWVESSAGVFGVVGSPPIPKRLEPEQQVGIELRFEPGSQGDFTGSFFAETEDGALLERDLVGQGCSDRDGDERCD